MKNIVYPTGHEVLCVMDKAALEKIAYFVDGDPAQQGGSVLGKPVKNPEALLAEDRDNLRIFIASPIYSEAIKEKLTSMGFEEGRHFLLANQWKGNAELPSFYRWDEAKEEQAFQKVMSFLADEKSRRVYEILFRFHQSTRRYYTPKSLATLAENLVGLRDTLNSQYFPEGLFALSEKEVFVDAGAFDGQTALDFVRRTGGHFSALYSFEPSKTHFHLAQENLGKLGDERIHLYNCGLWDKEESVYFSADINAGARPLSEAAASTDLCELKPITSVLTPAELDDVTFVKMDVEGCELRALAPFERLLAGERPPKLAICLYHSMEDMYTIPLYLQEVNPGYRFYVRHHGGSYTDTILYATVDSFQ